MKRQIRCEHNDAVNKDLGVVCNLRESNTVCKNCKHFSDSFIYFHLRFTKFHHNFYSIPKYKRFGNHKYLFWLKYRLEWERSDKIKF